MENNNIKKIKNSPENEIENIIEILENTLYFAVLKTTNSCRKLKSDGDLFYFTIDEEFIYQNYYYDFGPLNIACLFKYCAKLNKYLQYAKGVKGIVHYTCSNLDKRTNAAFLMGCYCVIYLKMQPKETFKLLETVGYFKPFLDASQFNSPFTLKLLDCFQAIEKAKTLNFFNFNDFNASEYDLYNKLEYGDLNWLLPRKFLAFIGPADNRTAHSPEFYTKYFLKNDVKTVIRLNNVLYDAYAFMQCGIQHYDLIFPDGSTPPKDILLKFLYIAESAPAAIAVHCKAGLGRTGSLIGAFLIKHYRMSAREAIAWLRICRPGSVIGQQQLWLEKIQNWLWRIGSHYRLQHYGEGDKIPKHKYGIYSKLWPMEREKRIKESRKNLLLQTMPSSVNSHHVNNTFLKSRRNSSVINNNNNKPNDDDDVKRTKTISQQFVTTTPDYYSFKHLSKFLSSVHGLEFNRGKKPSANVAVKRLSQSEKSITCNLDQAATTTITKKIIKKTSRKTLENTKKEIMHRNLLSSNPSSNNNNNNNKPTQGDKLNEIKLIRTKKPQKNIK